jgi:hypothetical protein
MSPSSSELRFRGKPLPSRIPRFEEGVEIDEPGRQLKSATPMRMPSLELFSDVPLAGTQSRSCRLALAAVIR